MSFEAVLESSLALFAIVNPLGSIPLFLQLTGDFTPRERRRGFRTGVLVAAAILFAFILVGEQFLTGFFHIEMSDLKAAGGLLLLVIAIDHLVFGFQARNVVAGKPAAPDHVGAVPIACPILAGPGAMMTVLLTASRHDPLTAAASVLVVMALTGLILRFIDPINRLLGKTVCAVLSKILCLFIAGIGMHLLLQGVGEYCRG